MKKQGWTVALVSGVLALGGCGGGSSSSDTNLVQIPTLNPPPAPTPTPTPSPSGPYTGQLDLGSMRFTRQPNAFLGELPFLNTATTSHAVLDVNSDGFLDIVFAFWTDLGPDERGKNVGDRPTPNKLAVFINQDGRQFVDQTDTYVSGGTDLGGATRKVEKVDLNGDGKLDLVFAVNREDGRSGDPVAFNSSRSAALVSQETGYRIFRFGDPDWNHNVVTGSLSSKTFVVASGFTGSESSYFGYVFENQNLTRAFRFPFQISPNTARFYSDGTSSDTNVLIQTQLFPNLLGVEAWIFRNGSWSKLGQFDNPFEYVKDIRFVQFAGTDESIAPVFKLGDDYILGGGGNAITESRFIKVSKNNPPLFVVKMDVPIIPNFNITSTTTVRSDDLVGQIRIAFYEINSNGVSLKSVPIVGEKVRTNFNFMSIIDIDRDGHDDIIVHAYSINGSPVIYKNNGEGGFNFQKIQDEEFFKYHRDTATPIIADFDNDGIFDIVTVPANGNDISKGRAMTDYVYYKGSRN